MNEQFLNHSRYRWTCIRKARHRLDTGFVDIDMSTTVKHTRTNTGLEHPSTHRQDYCTGNLDRKRDTVLDDFIPSIPEIDLYTFIQSFLPPLSTEVDVKIILTELFKSQIPCFSDERHFFWSAFATEPAKSSLSDTAMFKRLNEIYNNVIEK